MVITSGVQVDPIYQTGFKYINKKYVTNIDGCFTLRSIRKIW